jgi:hypothetical protein
MTRSDNGTRSMMDEGHRRYLRMGMALLVAISIAACVQSEPRSTILPSPSLAASAHEPLQTTYPPTATETMLPTAAPTTAPTPEAPSVRLDELPTGEYIAYEKTDAMEGSKHLSGLHLVSIDGVYQGRLAFLGEGRRPILMPEGKRLVLSLGGGLQVMDLLDHSLAPIAVSDRCHDPSLSPDGSALAASCYDAATHLPDIYVLYPDRGTRLLLTSWRDPIGGDYFMHPQWSPDGKWIAFQNLMGSDEPRPIPREGLYLTSTDCLSDLSTCEAATHGPIPCYYSYSWSPDSQTLACAEDAWIDIFGLDGRVSRTLHPNDTVWALAWSPDGKWIALSMDSPPDEGYSSVYIISVDGKELIRLIGEPHRDYFVRFWITIP